MPPLAPATNRFRADPPHPRQRQRKIHRKSKYGCANCKLRRVKCDETKPRCLKCASFGVGCSYEPGAAEMQFALAGTFKFDFGPTMSPANSLPPLPLFLPLAGACSNERYEMNRHDRAALSKFESTNVLTVGPTDYGRRFQESALKLSRDNPFLMHIILTLTLIHDMHLSGGRDKPKSSTLAFHFYHGVAYFNTKLSAPIASQDKDALWTAATLIGACAFANVTANSAEEAWPLAPPTPTDLDWLKLTYGKLAIYELSNPKRPGSVFKDSLTAFDYFILPTPLIDDNVLNLPTKFIEIYGLDKSSTIETNPYHAAATTLAQLLPLRATRENIPRLLSFVGIPNPTYQRLLEDRDPRALLLLAYWYAKSLECQQQWWISCRACLEGPAICTFLEAAFAGDAELMELVASPKAAFAAFIDAHSRSPRASN